jgi:hypothetical protein
LAANAKASDITGKEETVVTAERVEEALAESNEETRKDGQ